MFFYVFVRLSRSHFILLTICNATCIMTKIWLAIIHNTKSNNWTFSTSYICIGHCESLRIRTYGKNTHSIDPSLGLSFPLLLNVPF